MHTPSASTPGVGAQIVQGRFRHPYYGVGGWLAFFIFSIVFIGPVYHTSFVIQHFAHSMEIFAGSVHPYSLYWFYFVETFIGFAVYGYGMFAGIQLWGIRTNAVKHAKQFLVAIVLYRFAGYLMGIDWIALMVSERARETALSNFLVGGTARTVLRAAVYSAIWYTYLLRSERVRVTYLENS